jgi:hypothetical protein
VIHESDSPRTTDGLRLNNGAWEDGFYRACVEAKQRKYFVKVELYPSLDYTVKSLVRD